MPINYNFQIKELSNDEPFTEDLRIKLKMFKL